MGDRSIITHEEILGWLIDRAQGGSAEMIGLDAGVSKSTARRYLNELEAYGWARSTTFIARQNGGGRRTRWFEATEQGRAAYDARDSFPTH